MEETGLKPTDYEAFVKKINLYKENMLGESALILALASESGEVAGKFTKFVRDNTDYSKLKEDILDELGDCLWFITCIANIYGCSLTSLMEKNVDKLSSRVNRGVLRGSGDKR